MPAIKNWMTNRHFYSGAKFLPKRLYRVLQNKNFKSIRPKKFHIYIYIYHTLAPYISGMSSILYKFRNVNATFSRLTRHFF